MTATTGVPGVSALKESTTSSPTLAAAPLLAGSRLHFVGIGGCGMSGLARIARNAGAVCTGSDIAPSPAIDALRDEGFAVSLEQSAESVPADAQMLVISAAIPSTHPEVAEAARRGVKVIKYAQLLGQLMIGRIGVAVAGTHGKSSTTSMLSHILIANELDPSFIVGATCKQIGGGARSGKGPILVAEACEYDRSFHNFHPTAAVILNVEEDHIDCYGTLANVVESFRVFAQKLPDESAVDGGFLLINHEMPHRLAITAGLKARVETIGFAPQADWCVEVTPAPKNSGLGNRPRVRLMHQGNEIVTWQSPLPGDHMAYNAAAAAILAHTASGGTLSWQAIASAVESFEGLDRRMQRAGVKKVARGEVTVIDDYGHHPTEVDTTLRALRRHYQPKRLICVFQPHQHSRTRFLMEQFATSFSQADIVIVPHIYFSRDSEEERRAVSAGDLVDRLRQKKKQAMHLYPFGAIVEQLQVIAKAGDLIVTMGAGDVYKVGYEFLREQ